MRSENRLHLDFFNVGDGDWAILFDDASIRMLFGLTDCFFDDVSTFDDDLAFDGIDIENCALFAFVVTGNDLNGVTFLDVCLNTHCVIRLIFN